MTQIPGTPEIVPTGLPELWAAITPDCRVGSRRGLNQSCSPCQDFSNAMSYTQIGRQEEVDSRLLVVGSQTASLTPGPSFAHNLGCRCPNCQCEAIFDIYVSRPFQWHQEHPNARFFSPCCRPLNIRESFGTPNPHFFQVLGFTPTLGQSRVATNTITLPCPLWQVQWNVSMKSHKLGHVVDIPENVGLNEKLGTLLGGPSSLIETEPRKKKTTLLELSWHPGTSPFSLFNYSFVLYIFEIYCVLINKVLQGFTILPDVGVMHLSWSISIS